MAHHAPTEMPWVCYAARGLCAVAPSFTRCTLNLKPPSGFTKIEISSALLDCRFLPGGWDGWRGQGHHECDWTVGHNGHLYQVQTNVRATQVVREEWIDGALRITHQGHELAYALIAARPGRPASMGRVHRRRCIPGSTGRCRHKNSRRRGPSPKSDISILGRSRTLLNLVDTLIIPRCFLIFRNATQLRSRTPIRVAESVVTQEFGEALVYSNGGP